MSRSAGSLWLRFAARQAPATIAQLPPRCTRSKPVAGPGGSSIGDHLGIGGADSHPGRLVFTGGSAKESLAGKSTLKLKRWYHVLLVRDGTRVRVYLDGAADPEIDGSAPAARPTESTVFLGGRGDNRCGFEGRIDEVAVFGRALGRPQAIGVGAR